MIYNKWQFLPSGQSLLRAFLAGGSDTPPPPPPPPPLPLAQLSRKSCAPSSKSINAQAAKLCHPPPLPKARAAPTDLAPTLPRPCPPATRAPPASEINLTRLESCRETHKWRTSRWAVDQPKKICITKNYLHLYFRPSSAGVVAALLEHSQGNHRGTGG